MPQVVTFSNGNTITYLYTADGRKLRTIHVVNGTTTTTDYCGNLIYENGTQKLLLMEEGYIDLVNSNTYYYYLKDHQGNNRVVLSSSGTVAETNHYYPFGGTFATSNVQPYKYNGKELDTKNSLNWYDYGARHYDAALGRFMTQDRFAEKYSTLSPYQYAANSPVCNVDVNGDSIRIYVETTSNHGLGHSWISVGEGNNMIVYSYGRYDGTNKGTDDSSNSLANGPGVLIRLIGKEAIGYNQKKAIETNLNIFTISDISDTELMSELDAVFNTSTQLPNSPKSDYYNNPDAHIIDEYSLLNNNCTTKVSEVLNRAGSQILIGDILVPAPNYGMWKSYKTLQIFNTPMGLLNHLKNVYKDK